MNGEDSVITVNVNRQNNLSIGDLFQLSGGASECPKFGALEYGAISGFCECKSGDGVLGTFTDRWDFDIGTTSGRDF